MFTKFIIFSLVLLISIFNFACSSSETPANIENNNSSNINIQNDVSAKKPEANTKSVIGTKSTPKIATTNEAPTLTPVYKAFCEAMNKKDEAALRKILTKDTIKYWEEEMKEEERNMPIVEYIAETEQIRDVSKCGVRNEKISGNTALAEIRNENVPNGFVIKFVKVNGEWKITNQSPEF